MNVFRIHEVSSETNLIEAVEIEEGYVSAEDIVENSGKIMPMILGEEELTAAWEEGELISVSKDGDQHTFVCAFSDFPSGKAATEIMSYLEVRDFEVYDEDGQAVVEPGKIVQREDSPYSHRTINGKTYAGVEICPTSESGDVLSADEVTDTKTVSVRSEDGPIGFFYRDVGEVNLLYLREEESGEHVMESYVKSKEAIADAIRSSDSARTRTLPDFSFQFDEFAPATEIILVASDEAAGRNEGSFGLTKSEMQELSDSEVMNIMESVDVSSFMPSYEQSVQDVNGNNEQVGQPGIAIVDQLDSGPILKNQSEQKVPPIVVAAIASSSKGGSWTKGNDPLVVDRTERVGIILTDNLYSSENMDVISSLPGDSERRHKSAQKQAESGTTFGASSSSSGSDGSNSSSSGSSNSGSSSSGSSGSSSSGSVGDALDGYAFSATGREENLTREDVKDLIENNGGDFEPFMSDNVDFLIEGDTSPRSVTDKLEYARENSIPIVDLSDVEDVIDGLRTIGGSP